MPSITCMFSEPVFNVGRVLIINDLPCLASSWNICAIPRSHGRSTTCRLDQSGV